MGTSSPAAASNRPSTHSPAETQSDPPPREQAAAIRFAEQKGASKGAHRTDLVVIGKLSVPVHEYEPSKIHDERPEPSSRIELGRTPVAARHGGVGHGTATTTATT